jgi:hypothetical protein
VNEDLQKHVDMVVDETGQDNRKRRIGSADTQYVLKAYILLCTSWLLLQTLVLNTTCMFEKRYLFSSASERHCKQCMETKRLAPFFISAKLVRFVLVMAALWISVPYNIGGFFRRFRRTNHI